MTSADLNSVIASRLKASLTPVRARPSITVIAARFALALLVLAGALAAMMGLAGFAKMSALEIVGTLAVFATAAVLLSVSLAWQITPGVLQKISPAACIAILAAGFITATVLLFPWHTPEAFFARGWPCLAIGFAVSCAAAGMFWLLARRGAPFATATLGGTLGAIAGLVALSFLQLTCDRQEAEHLVFWHGGVLLLSTLAGVLLARWAEQRKTGRP